MSAKVPIRVTIHDAGSGVDSLTGKETDGITVSFEDGTVSNSFLSWKSFKQLLSMKSKQGEKAPAPVALAQALKPTGNALPVGK